jgi:Tfp pilus assembly protein PilN
MRSRRLMPLPGGPKRTPTLQVSFCSTTDIRNYDRDKRRLSMYIGGGVLVLILIILLIIFLL